MDNILRFIVNHQSLWIGAVCVFALMLVGFIADLKRPKKLKKQVDEEDEMKKKIYELKNSPLANTKLNDNDDSPGLKM